MGVETHELVDDEIDFSVWDFAGQLEYLSTHQHFFSSANAIYVVAIDASKSLEMQRESLQRWLATLAAKLGGADTSAIRVLIIGTKIDLLKERFHVDIASAPILAAMQEWPLPYNPTVKKRVIFTSSVTSAGVRDLKALLSEAAVALVRKKQAEVSSDELSRSVLRIGEMLSEAQESDISLIVQPSSIMPIAVLRAMHDRGVVLLNEEVKIVCIWPSLLSRVIALFVCPTDHRKLLTGIGTTSAREPLVPDADAIRALKLIPELQAHTPEHLGVLLRTLESLGVCYHISAEEAAVYGQVGGFLFPSLRPACELFQLPIDERLAARAPLFCLAFQFRVPFSAGTGPEVFTALQIKIRPLHDTHYRLFSNCMILRSPDRVNQALVTLQYELQQPLLRLFLRGLDPKSLFTSILACYAPFGQFEMEQLCPVCAQASRFVKVEMYGNGSAALCADGHDVKDIDAGVPIDRTIASRNSLWSAQEADRFLSAGTWQRRGQKGLTFTELREGEADEARRREFNRVRQMFYKFVGQDREQNFVLDKVVFLRNDACERSFASFYADLVAANLEVGRRIVNEGRFDRGDTEADTTWRRWVLRHLENYTERVSGNDRVNLIAAWHGTSEETVWRIAEENFLEPAELDAKLKSLGKEQTDPGYFGKGIYFTQFPSYGASYARSTSCLLLSWVLMGRAYPVIEEPLLKVSPGERTLLGSSCKPGFHSHYVVVKQKGPTFLPCPPQNAEGGAETPDYDEVVVFKRHQILPRYVVYFHRSGDAPPPMPLPAASGARNAQADDASHSHAPLVVLWVDSGFAGGGQDGMVNMLRKAAPPTHRQIHSFVCSDELKMWLRTHWACGGGKKKFEVRVITNRRRDHDGGEHAGEELIAWLRSTKECPDWAKIRCLLFCAQVAKVQHVRAKEVTFVTAEAAKLAQFCEANVKWKHF